MKQYVKCKTIIRQYSLCTHLCIFLINILFFNLFFFHYRLVKGITDQLIIEDWESHKAINDALPAHRRKNIEKEGELQRPMFQANAIGALHEAGEAFLLSTNSFFYFGSTLSTFTYLSNLKKVTNVSTVLSTIR